MKAPIYIFLNFVNFYQNHRAMINSFSRVQLEDDGEPILVSDEPHFSQLTEQSLGQPSPAPDSSRISSPDSS